jgi:glucosamine kinase
MIAIAESGSTKCDWVILDQQGRIAQEFKTQGFNPYFHSSDFVRDTLMHCTDLAPMRENITHLYFYGAGCSSTDLNAIIHSGLSQVFSKALISVEHDLVASAYSLYQGEPIIACIIGTGSNSCFFDGQKVHEYVPALGFILGDEASGSYFGKRVLADFFYHRLPSEMHHDFKERFDLKWSETLGKVYSNVHANVYLASFMRFIADHRENAYVVEMVKEGMARFIDIHVTHYPDYHRHKVGFVGSIAHLFTDILHEELAKRDCKPGLIIKHPVQQLVDYHLNYKNILALA